MTFTPKPTPTENRAEAERWLDKAVLLESEGKSQKIVNLALNKACEYENAAAHLQS